MTDQLDRAIVSMARQNIANKAIAENFKITEEEVLCALKRQNYCVECNAK